MVWQYLLTTSIDGKQPGWHPYTPDASEMLTELQLEATTQRYQRTVYQVKSGYFTYQVNIIAMTQRNITTGTVRQIRQSANIFDQSPNKKMKTSSMAVPLQTLFGGGCAHTWEELLTSKLESMPDVDFYLGVDRHADIVPVRELTFQALKPNPPVEWRVIVLGQNPYPRLESATGIAMFDAAFDDWNDKKFGSTSSIRNIIKAAAINKYSISKLTNVNKLRQLLQEKKILSPPQWFQAMLAQGVLLLNASLTTGGPKSNSSHTSFWRPIIETIIDEILRSKSKLPNNDERKGLVFLWWGSVAIKMKKSLRGVLDKYIDNVPVTHVDWCNPAAQGDKFCDNPPHFLDVNNHMKDMGMKEIDWLPNESWLENAHPGYIALGDFILDTKKLHSMYLERLQNGLDCEQSIVPITGVRLMKVKNFVDACAPIGLASEAIYALDTVEGMGGNKLLTNDEKGAVYLYTGNSLYARLNRALRSPNREDVTNYFSYLLLFLLAHDKMKKNATKQLLFRGINKDVTYFYKQGSKITWWNISSCSSRKEVAKNFCGTGTLFHVTTKTAVPIMDLSAYVSEDEYVLAPGTRLKVIKVVKRKQGLSDIFVEEIEDAPLVT